MVERRWSPGDTGDDLRLVVAADIPLGSGTESRAHVDISSDECPEFVSYASPVDREGLVANR